MIYRISGNTDGVLWSTCVLIIRMSVYAVNY